jgi:hypothetical protein
MHLLTVCSVVQALLLALLLHFVKAPSCLLDAACCALQALARLLRLEQSSKASSYQRCFSTFISAAHVPLQSCLLPAVLPYLALVVSHLAAWLGTCF